MYNAYSLKLLFKENKTQYQNTCKTFFLNNNEFIIKDTEEEVELPSFVENWKNKEENYKEGQCQI